MPSGEHLRKLINRALALAGVKLVKARVMREPNALFLLKARAAGVQTLLDVGANVGQFVQSLRSEGYRGRAVSFEPLSEAHGLLVANAAADPDWIVAPRAAIGSATGEAQINISGNSASSSLLEIQGSSTEVLPLTGTIASETIPVRRLDDLMQPGWDAPYALKIDTQGFELEVLRGASAVLAQTAVLTIELSLAHLYSGGARVADVFALLEGQGFRAIAITEGFSDTVRNEMLQVDAIFVRD